MRPDLAIEFWEGETKEIGHGLTLIRCGGHFDGGVVLHWPDDADGNGVILSGDMLQVVQDRRRRGAVRVRPHLWSLVGEVSIHRCKGGCKTVG